MLRVDAHHHLWRFTPEEYGWIDDGMAALRRDFLLDDLRREIRSADVATTVVVQARQTVEETEWLLSLAGPGSPIAGVVGWLPLASTEMEPLLERFCGAPALKGLRHVVQGEPAGFLEGSDFNRGVRAVGRAGLVYDILIFAPQLREATRFLDRHSDQPFVLDHIAKPAIKAGEVTRWSEDIREFARRPHVSCKISGMVTEADFTRWSPEQLQPYFEVVLQAFGPERLMIGTDWPVLTVGCQYSRWWRTVEQWISPLSPTEKAHILGGTASRVYGLSLTASTTAWPEAEGVAR